MGANMGTFNEVALESILSRYENKMELIRETEIYKWEARDLGRFSGPCPGATPHGPSPRDTP